MTKKLIKILLAALPCMLAACGNDDMGEEPAVPSTIAGDIAFEIGFAPQTRVATDADFKCAWEDGDQVGVFAVSHGGSAGTPAASGNYFHNVKLTYSGGLWSTESGTQLWWPNNGNVLDFYAYYPYNADADPTDMTFTVKSDQSGTTGGKSNHNLSDLMTATSAGYTKGETVSLHFSHAMAMVQLTLANTSGTETTKPLTVKLRNLQTAATLDWTLGATVSGNTGEITMYPFSQSRTTHIFRALVPAQTLSQGSVPFQLTYNGDTFQGTALTSPIALSAGNADKFTQSVRLLTIQPEANSYMIAPNGATILIPISQANRVLTADGLGAPTGGLGGVTAGNYTVEQVWGDRPFAGATGVLSSVTPVVYKDKACIEVVSQFEGNVVIAIRDKTSNKIKWSWHIWVTKPVESKRDAETGLTWMDRNLGAVGTTYNANGRNGLFYQWGRKDAFPASDGTGVTEESKGNQVYFTGIDIIGTTDYIATGNYYSLPDMVQNPFGFSTNASFNGSLDVSGNLNKSWDNVGKKTLYDPCPPGWKVPPYNSKSNWGANATSDNSEWTFQDYIRTNKGALFNGVNGRSSLGHFYPATGYRRSNTGAVYSAGIFGYYWSATPGSASNSWNLYFGPNGVLPHYSDSRGHGCSVRCVAE